MHDQHGFAIGLARGQGTGHADTREVIGDQQGPVQSVGVQESTRGLGRIEVALQFLRLDALGRFALEAQAAKTGLDDLHRDHTLADVLLGQVGAHEPAGVPVGRGDGVGQTLQACEIEFAADELGHRRRQLGLTQQAVACKADGFDLDGDAIAHLDFRRRRDFRWAHRLGQAELAGLLDLLAQAAGIGDVGRRLGLGDGDEHQRRKRRRRKVALNGHGEIQQWFRSK